MLGCLCSVVLCVNAALLFVLLQLTQFFKMNILIYANNIESNTAYFKEEIYYVLSHQNLRDPTFFDKTHF